MMNTTIQPIATVTSAVQTVISAAMQNMSTDRTCLAISAALPLSMTTLASNATSSGKAVPISIANGSRLRISRSSPGGSTRPYTFLRNRMRTIINVSGGREGTNE